MKGEVVSADFFETLGIHPFLGRSLAGRKNQQAVVISYALWSRSFGSDPHVIGRSIALDGYAYEVVGVMPRGFQFPDPENGTVGANQSSASRLARGNYRERKSWILCDRSAWPQRDVDSGAGRDDSDCERPGTEVSGIRSRPGSQTRIAARRYGGKVSACAAHLDGLSRACADDRVRQHRGLCFWRGPPRGNPKSRFARRWERAGTESWHSC